MALASPPILAQESPAPVPSPVGAVPSASPAVAASPAASALAGTRVGVTLVEFTVTTDTAPIPAGAVTLDATNTSSQFDHELVVVRTDLGGGDLPTNEDGSFDEEGEGVEVVTEIEEFAPGTSQTVTADLTPGHYVFLCNVVVDVNGEPLSHYANGMWLDVEVAGSGTAVTSPAASVAAMSAAPVASVAPLASPAAEAAS
jgi:hypothetical protein